MTHHFHLKSFHLRFIFDVIHSMSFDKYKMTYIYQYRVIQNSLIALKILCVLVIHPSFPHKSMCLVVSFPQCLIVGLIQFVAFSNWLLSLSNMHLGLLHAFSWLGNSLVVNSIGLPQWLSNARDAGSIMGWEDPLATHSRIRGYKIPWTEGSGGLQWGRERFGCDLATKQYYIAWMDQFVYLFIHWRISWLLPRVGNHEQNCHKQGFVWT